MDGWLTAAALAGLEWLVSSEANKIMIKKKKNKERDTILKFKVFF